VTHNIYKRTAIIKFWKHIYLPVECNFKVIKSLWAGNRDWAMPPVKSKNDLLCNIPSCRQEAYLSGEKYRINALINKKGYGS